MRGEMGHGGTAASRRLGAWMRDNGRDSRDQLANWGSLAGEIDAGCGLVLHCFHFSKIKMTMDKMVKCGDAPGAFASAVPVKRCKPFFLKRF